ncbi:MAG: SRPBCC family protein [Frankiales bacterium]|nr:SRPBCC family protein [Frankiales bacterium]
MTRQISHSIVIDADPATVFDVLADPSQHALFDGSESVKGQLSGPPRLHLGAQFSMRMHWAAPYVIRNTVVAYVEDTTIAWRHFGRHVWRYDLRPVDGSTGSTEVTETFDWAPAYLGFAYQRTGLVARNDRAIRDTLRRLKVLVESRVVTPR